MLGVMWGAKLEGWPAEMPEVEREIWRVRASTMDALSRRDVSEELHAIIAEHVHAGQ